jgi:hypothetical protein
VAINASSEEIRRFKLATPERGAVDLHSGTEFFGRVVSVEFGTMKIEGLRIVFKAEKDLKKDPNTLDLTIFNMSEDSRRTIQNNIGTQIKVVAGYIGNLEQIFIGDISTVTSTRTGTEWVTKISAGDALNAIRQARVSESFAPGTSLSDVASKIIDSIDTGKANAKEEFAKGNLRGGIDAFVKGFSIFGDSSTELDKLARTTGREMSFQDGSLQVMKDGDVFGTDVVFLSPETGLVGAPEVGEKGIVKVRSLIQQKLLPGRLLSLSSDSLVGDYRIEKVKFSGDNFGGEWYADIEMRIR